MKTTPLVLFVVACILYMPVLAQDDATTTVKRGIATTYYIGTDQPHYEGRIKNNQRDGTWKWYAYKDDGTRLVYQYMNYEEGVLEGPYRKIQGDTITMGVYVAGQMHGVYEQMRFKPNAVGDTTKVPMEEGQYAEGKKTGYWKKYNKGKLAHAGYYSNNQKIKAWKTYGIHTISEKPDLMMETEYVAGKKQGKQTVHFEYVQEAGKHIKKEGIKTYTWYNDVLNGSYEVMDENKFVVEKGEYVDGKKNGEIYFKLKEENMIKKSHYHDGVQMGPAVFENKEGKVLIEGGYNNDLKNGTWVYYTPEGLKQKMITYKDGVLDGDRYTYDADGKKATYQSIKNGLLHGMSVYDANGDYLFEFTVHESSKGGEWTSVLETAWKQDTMIDASIEAKIAYPVNPETFLKEYEALKFKQTDFYKNGTQEKRIGDQMELVESGNFTNHKRDGLWEFFEHPTVTKQITYQAGNPIKEEYLDKKTKVPFKGDYIVKFPDGKLKYEFRIKNGLKHGKCNTYDVDGMLLLEEKFKEGVLDN